MAEDVIIVTEIILWQLLRGVKKNSFGPGDNVF